MLYVATLLLAAALPLPHPGEDLDNRQTAPANSRVLVSDCAGRTFANAEEALRSGCCSHHNGVCGCSGGRAACCDGTLSPTCGCD
jgi:hypothetical protein